MSFAGSSSLPARPLALAIAAIAAACVTTEHPSEPVVTEPPIESSIESSIESPRTAAAVGREPISSDPVVLAIVELAGEDSQVDDHVRTLAVDIGPRLTGSTQLANAEQWAVERLASWGLRVTRERWGELPVAFERGPASGQMIRPEREPLEFTTWAWTPGTRGQDGLEAGGPVRGQALRYPTTAKQLRALEPYSRNAWIMLPWSFDQRSLDATLRQQIERKLERAPIAGLVWAAGDANDLLIESLGDHRLDPDALPKRVEIRLRGDQHAALLERIDAGEYVELEFGVANRLLPGPVPAHNVIAELPGESLPDQRVIVGAQLDSWDGASGALDNATGVATTLEAARLIAAACQREDVQRHSALVVAIAAWNLATSEAPLAHPNTAALPHGEANKLIIVERGETDPLRIELALDRTVDPDEQARQRRRDHRSARFGPLRSWDRDEEAP